MENREKSPSDKFSAAFYWKHETFNLELVNVADILLSSLFFLVYWEAMRSITLKSGNSIKMEEEILQCTVFIIKLKKGTCYAACLKFIYKKNQTTNPKHVCREQW